VPVRSIEFPVSVPHGRGEAGYDFDNDTFFAQVISHPDRRRLIDTGRRYQHHRYPQQLLPLLGAHTDAGTATALHGFLLSMPYLAPRTCERTPLAALIAARASQPANTDSTAFPIDWQELLAVNEAVPRVRSLYQRATRAARESPDRWLPAREALRDIVAVIDRVHTGTTVTPLHCARTAVALTHPELRGALMCVRVPGTTAFWEQMVPVMPGPARRRGLFQYALERLGDADTATGVAALTAADAIGRGYAPARTLLRADPQTLAVKLSELTALGERAVTRLGAHALLTDAATLAPAGTAAALVATLAPARTGPPTARTTDPLAPSEPAFTIDTSVGTGAQA
jgi:hypothetical protein